MTPCTLARLEQRLPLDRQLPIPPNLLIRTVECKLDQRCRELINPDVKFRVRQQARQRILSPVHGAYPSEYDFKLIGVLLGRLDEYGLGTSLTSWVSYPGSNLIYTYIDRYLES